MPEMASVPAELVPNTAGVRLASEDGTEILVDHRITQRSEFLKTALDCHAEGTERPLVMVSTDVLSAWLAFVQQPEHQHGDCMSVESLEVVLRVCLMLILINPPRLLQLSYLLRFGLLPVGCASRRHRAALGVQEQTKLFPKANIKPAFSSITVYYSDPDVLDLRLARWQV